MSTLNEYLAQKRDAVANKRRQVEAGLTAASTISAKVTAEGRSGVRRIRIRDFQVISDSPRDFAGYELGPTSPELQLGVLGSCLTHIFLIQAAVRKVPLDSLSVEISGRIDPRAGSAGFEATPIWPHAISYVVNVESPASAADIAALHEAVEAACPILNLLKKPQVIEGRIEHVTPGLELADAAD